MTNVIDPVVDRSSRAIPDAGTGRPARRWAVPVLLQIVAMIGLGALVYPSASDWFTTLQHNAEISGYVESLAQAPTADREQMLAEARDYNTRLPAGVLRDPYSGGDIDGDDADYRAYERSLAVAGTDVIAQLDYPRLGIVLPVYHGTDDDVLARGVGHLYGSSLPVGGPGTHAVLTSHSGLPSASLFTPLPEAVVGDEFTIEVLGEKLSYRVDDIETVLPTQTQSLRAVAGEDRVTLVTCTPIGINSHRLLVHAVRTAAPATAAVDAIAGDGRDAGFPWWAVAFGGGSVVVAVMLFAPRRRRSRPEDEAPSAWRGEAS